MQDYRKLAFTGVPDDATREDLEDVLAELMERNVPASPEIVNALLEKRREYKARVKRASLIDLPDNLEYTAALRVEMERQYPIMKEALGRFGFATHDIPAWETGSFVIDDIHHRLSPHMLFPAQKLIRPTLLMIPPCFNFEMTKIIDTYRLSGQKKCVYPGSWKGVFSDFFGKNWDDRPRQSEAWGIAIAEGEPNIPVREDWLGEGSNRFSQWRARINAQGLKVMDTACAWLTLWMAKAHQGEFVDFDSPNILKTTPFDISHASGLVIVRWAGDRIKFEVQSDYGGVSGIHARGLVWIVKPS